MVDGNHAAIVHALDGVEGDTSGVVPRANGLIELGHREAEVDVGLQTAGCRLEIVLGNLEFFLKVAHGIALLLGQFDALQQREQVGVGLSGERGKEYAEGDEVLGLHVTLRLCGWYWDGHSGWYHP